MTDDVSSTGFRSMKNVMLTIAAALVVTACASSSVPTVMNVSTAVPAPQARSYLVSEDASGDVDAALERTRQSGKRVMLVMGANWCGDSRALAGWLATERFAELIERKYELVFVNIGMPGTGDGHNLGIARRFGVSEVPGLPNVLVLTGDGVLVNPKTATSWRNAASRSEDAIYDELAELADRPI
jgi:Thioredoxin-like